MNIEQIGIHALAIDDGCTVVVLHPHRSVGPKLIVTCWRQQGYMLELTDSLGTTAWEIMLNGEGALNPQFAKEYPFGD